MEYIDSSDMVTVTSKPSGKSISSKGSSKPLATLALMVLVILLPPSLLFLGNCRVFA
ncbi:hypothetical protein MBAV_003446 [Candidatus Magnetobacterium bavaricum]|uniref:Uncharacterized protein n=1 Tax=Candidatus Magnetobacterium bavaricum TaxID=29290 RepID=A0A0F3GR28_9BACT|nr:hypothetical protein MBAV_003446 [Candidatus Magnetobacterium bavaricum]